MVEGGGGRQQRHDAGARIFENTRGVMMLLLLLLLLLLMMQLLLIEIEEESPRQHRSRGGWGAAGRVLKADNCAEQLAQEVFQGQVVDWTWAAAAAAACRAPASNAGGRWEGKQGCCRGLQIEPWALQQIICQLEQRQCTRHDHQHQRRQQDHDRCKYPDH
jgi:hypothetical protein